MGEDGNLELVRAVWDEFMRMSIPIELFDDEVVWHTAADLPDRETAHGPAGVAAMLAEGWATVTEPEIWVDDMQPVGEMIVVAWGARGTGRVSGAPIEWREAHVYGVREGLVAEVWEFRSREEAITAAEDAN